MLLSDLHAWACRDGALEGADCMHRHQVDGSLGMAIDGATDGTEAIQGVHGERKWMKPVAAAAAPGIATLCLHVVAMDEQMVPDNAVLHLPLCHQWRLARRVEQTPKSLHRILCMRMHHQKTCTCT